MRSAGRTERMLEKPSVAIVVPTRNRSNFVFRAVASVTMSGMEDVSLVVSDNSSEPEAVDILARHCRELNDPRVSYIRPPRNMSMADHWNWAMSHVLGRGSVTHVLYLSDRMVFRSDALSALCDILRRHPDDVVTFNFDSVADRDEPIQLVQNPWSGAIVPMPSQRFLDLAAQGDVLHRATPRMLNCAAPVTILREIRQRFGEVFGSLAPDYCFAYRCLSVVDTILYYDRSCIVEYGQHKSHGTNIAHGRPSPEHTDFLSLTGPQGLNFAAPIPGLDTSLNAIFHEYCFVRSEVDDDTFKPLALEPYLERLAAEVARFEDPTMRAEALRILRENGWGGHDWQGTAGRLVQELVRMARDPRRTTKRVKRAATAHIAGHWVMKPVWLRLARWGVSPPAEQRFRYGTVDEALDYALRFPRRPSNDLSHLNHPGSPFDFNSGRMASPRAVSLVRDPSS